MFQLLERDNDHIVQNRQLDVEHPRRALVAVHVLPHLVVGVGGHAFVKLGAIQPGNFGKQGVAVKAKPTGGDKSRDRGPDLALRHKEPFPAGSEACVFPWEEINLFGCFVNKVSV